MTWLWIIAFLATFLFITAREARWRWLSFQSFLQFVPLYILIIYLSGSYFYYLFESFVLFPLSINQLLLYISPYQYSFSSVWIILWILLWWRKFLKNKEKRTARLHSFFYGLIRWLVPLGFFLLLWDNFIWLPTEWWFYVSAIRHDSNLAIYDKVIPLGFYLSLLGLLWGSIMFLIHRTLSLRHIYLCYAITSFALSILFIFQQYPRRLVFTLWWTTMDSKQIVLRGITLFFLTLWIIKQKKASKEWSTALNENTL